jgi:hypothetical protein
MTDEDLQNIGVMKMAQIALSQEDVVPTDAMGNPITQ